MRKIIFEIGEHYHVYNRGVDKRSIVMEEYDSDRFLQSLEEFNVVEPIGSIYENSFNKDKESDTSLGNPIPKLDKLVNIVCYCLNPNHFHLLLEQVAEDGIVKFMHKLGLGYTNYFNKKYKRGGPLFGGRFKAKHIATNDYLQYVSAYINLNDRVHQIGGGDIGLVRSSWDEYLNNKKTFCDTAVILEQFGSVGEYEDYCLDTLPIVIENKKLSQELQNLGFEE